MPKNADGTALGIGVGVGLGIGVGVELGIGIGVGDEVGRGVSFGVGFNLLASAFELLIKNNSPTAIAVRTSTAQLHLDLSISPPPQLFIGAPNDRCKPTDASLEPPLHSMAWALRHTDASTAARSTCRHAREHFGTEQIMSGMRE
jgi:hypothetical protein